MANKTRHNLPRQTFRFVGRNEIVSEAFTQLRFERSYLIAIWGAGGVGKTSLALHLAHLLKDQKVFEAIIWTSSRTEFFDKGKIKSVEQTPLQTLDQLLDKIAEVYDYQIMGRTIAEKQKEIKNFLSGKSALIVVDNLEALDDSDEAKILWFVRVLPEPCKAIVTARNKLVGHNEYSIQLTSMSWEESRDLILSILRKSFPTLNTPELLSKRTMRQIFELTGGNPLAIKWLIGQARTKWLKTDVEKLLDQIAENKGDMLLEYCFNNTYSQLLRNRDFDSRNLLFAVSRIDTPFSIDSVKEICNWPSYRISSALNTLVKLSLLEANDEEETPEEYELLPLTRTYVIKKFDTLSDADKAKLIEGGFELEDE